MPKTDYDVRMKNTLPHDIALPKAFQALTEAKKQLFEYYFRCRIPDDQRGGVQIVISSIVQCQELLKNLAPGIDGDTWATSH
jgi:hypothetical protein